MLLCRQSYDLQDSITHMCKTSTRSFSPLYLNSVGSHIDVLKIEIDGVRAMLRFPAVVNKVNDPELELATVESTFLVKGKSLVTNVGKEASSPLITASAGASVHRASVILVLKKIRRLPIATKELVGIITARDLGEVYAK